MLGFVISVMLICACAVYGCFVNPQTQTVYIGDPFELSCQSIDNESVNLEFQPENSTEFQTVIAAGRVLVDRNNYGTRTRYQLENGTRGSGLHTLKILSASPQDAGIYTCMEQEGMDRDRSCNATVSVLNATHTPSVLQPRSAVAGIIIAIVVAIVVVAVIVIVLVFKCRERIRLVFQRNSRRLIISFQTQPRKAANDIETQNNTDSRPTSNGSNGYGPVSKSDGP